MLVNIHDIAKLAGVSVSTVSKVMNGKDKDISEKTKQRVLKVIEEEQYIPYLKFREKEGLKSHLIGLVLKKDNREGDRIIHSAQKAACGEGVRASGTICGKPGGDAGMCQRHAEKEGGRPYPGFGKACQYPEA